MKNCAATAKTNSGYKLWSKRRIKTPAGESLITWLPKTEGKASLSENLLTIFQHFSQWEFGEIFLLWSFGKYNIFSKLIKKHFNCKIFLANFNNISVAMKVY